MRYATILFILIISLTACGLNNEFEDYDHFGVIKSISHNPQSILIETTEGEEMFLLIDDKTEMVRFEFADLEVENTIKVWTPYLIEESKPSQTLAAKIVLLE